MTEGARFQEFSDCVQPFLIHESNIKGRMVRLGEVVDTILSRHKYPEVVSRLLGELVVLAALLSARLKEQGVLTVQIKGEGLVRFMVADAVHGGMLRGYAQLAEGGEERLAAMTGEEPAPLAQVFGKGILAITLQSGPEAPPYQGIVSLEGDSLSEAVQGYFTASEQTEVLVKTTIGRSRRNGWRAGGIMLQHIPFEGGRQPRSNVLSFEHFHHLRELWSRSRMFTETVMDDELLDTRLSPRELLFRLFNEDGVWVYEPSGLSASCRCSREKIEATLRSFSRQDIEDMLVDGALSVNCQFCNREEVFKEADLARLYEQ